METQSQQPVVRLTDKEFNALPNKEKRILIAKDVILRATEKDFRVMQGNAYFASTKLQKNFKKSKSIEPIELRTVLPDYKCTVCAQGALFYCDIMARNNFNVNEFDFYSNSLVDDEKIIKKIDYFSSYQLGLIEAVFEGYLRLGFFYNHNLTPYDKESGDLSLKVDKFYNKHRGVNKRLIAIMQNIIDNDGEFIL